MKIEVLIDLLGLYLSILIGIDKVIFWRKLYLLKFVLNGLFKWIVLLKNIYL